MTDATACPAPAREAGAVARVRVWLACRRCMVGWTVYLAAAAAAVAFFGR